MSNTTIYTDESRLILHYKVHKAWKPRKHSRCQGTDHGETIQQFKRERRHRKEVDWQNGIAERWVGSCRREILDHVIVLNEKHLRRLVQDYVNYHHQDRTHDSLHKDTPNRRPAEKRPSPTAKIISGARLGGLHHRYGWGEAA
jgi:hypothetical protein